MTKGFSTQEVLELACAAQRINGNYQKEEEAVYADQGNILYFKISNKALMRYTLDPEKQALIGMEAYMTKLSVLPEDTELANSIKTHFRKFMFSAVEGSNEFQTNINSILNGDTVAINQFGYVACLPSVYKSDIMKTNVKRAAKKVDEGWLGEVGENLLDLDCEILSSVRSKNYDAWNIDATINNKLVSWMSKIELKTGPCVVIKARIKDTSKHWKHETPVTRLNYVKAAQ